MRLGVRLGVRLVAEDHEPDPIDDSWVSIWVPGPRMRDERSKGSDHHSYTHLGFPNCGEEFQTREHIVPLLGLFPAPKFIGCWPGGVYMYP